MNSRLIHRRIKSLVSMHNGENPIHAKDISRVLDIPDTQSSSYRNTRNLVVETVEVLQVPIVSGRRGYWLAATKEELDNHVKSLQGTAIAYFRRAKIAKKAYRKHYGIKRRPQ